MTRDDKISAAVFGLMSAVLTGALMGMGSAATEPLWRAALVLLGVLFGAFFGLVASFHWRRP